MLDCWIVHDMSYTVHNMLYYVRSMWSMKISMSCLLDTNFTIQAKRSRRDGEWLDLRLKKAHAGGGGGGGDAEVRHYLVLRAGREDQDQIESGDEDAICGTK